MKKILSIILVTCLIISMLPIFSIKSQADVPSTQKVTAHSDSWGNYDFTYSMHSKYYKIQDATGIPQSTLLNPQYFYTNDNVTFNSVSGTDLFMLILNRGIGLILDPDNISTYINAFYNAIGPNHLDNTNSKYVQGGLYDSHDNFLGYCLDDITGCYWEYLQTDNYTVPKEQIDNVNNFIDYYDSTKYPDFITYYPLSNTYLLNHTNMGQTSKDNITNNLANADISFFVFKSPSDTYFNFTSAVTGQNYSYFYSDSGVDHAIFRSGDWNLMCNKFGLINNNEMLGSEIYSITANDYVNKYIFVDLYDSNNNQITNFKKYDFGNDAISNVSVNDIYFGLYVNRLITFFNVDKITIYKTQNILDSLNNQTYYPSSYITDSYNNENTDLSTSITQTLNSVRYNNSIYNDSNDNYYNYYENNNYDSSSNITNVTNITNNYYSGNNDNPDNPDNPDDPDDNKTLDAILAAILRFFNAIGDIIGTVLAGLVNMISAVLESIAELTSDITNLSDVFSSLLAWLPDPVPQVIGIGLSLVIIAGVIKFIRG